MGKRSKMQHPAIMGAGDVTATKRMRSERLYARERYTRACDEFRAAVLHMAGFDFNEDMEQQIDLLIGQADTLILETITKR